MNISDLADQYGFSANGGVIDGNIAAQLCLELGLTGKCDAPNPRFFGVGAMAAIVDERDPVYFVSALCFHGPSGEPGGYWIHVAPKAKYRREDVRTFIKVLADQMELRFAGLRHLTADDFN